MQPISNVSAGSSGGLPPRPIQSGQTATSMTISTGGQTQSVSMSSSSQSMTVSNVPSQVAELLQSIGGGLENDKALQLLIAIILLLALLRGSQDESQDGSKSAADILRLLGGGQQGQAQSITLLSSSTVTFQQTSISMVSVSSVDFGSSAAAGGTPSVGQELDASA